MDKQYKHKSSSKGHFDVLDAMVALLDYKRLMAKDAHKMALLRRATLKCIKGGKR